MKMLTIDFIIKTNKMKTRILYPLTTLLCLLFMTLQMKAQAPLSIPYQAVARDVAGSIVPNRTISLRFSVHDGTAAGPIVYAETQSILTNALGSFTTNIGAGVVITGTFSGINWGSGSKHLQVELDITGGVAYVDMGTKQMMSVPYSLYSANGAGWKKGATIVTLENDSNFVGIGASTPNMKLHVAHTDSSLLLLENKQLLNSNVSSGVYFKIGSSAASYTGAIKAIGTSSSSARLGFFTDASSSTVSLKERLSISDVGNVGVGNVSPTYKLDVTGRSRFRASTLNDVNTSAGFWMDDYRTGSDRCFLGMQDSVRMGIFGNGGLGWGFNLNTKSGNATIGTISNDYYRLVIGGSSNGLGLYNSSNDYYGSMTSSTDGNLVIKSTYGSTIFSPISGTVTNPSKDILFNPPSNGFQLLTFPGGVGINVDSATAKFHVNGNVMIGSGAPANGYKLSVDGKIIAEEIKVQLNSSWPDYVFDKKYPLASLHSLDKYIQTYKHLPNIPAAHIMEKEGIALGDMQTRMMEKIEELTLYIIDLQKQLDELKSKKDK
jgi:hypothetical protein